MKNMDPFAPSISWSMDGGIFFDQDHYKLDASRFLDGLFDGDPLDSDRQKDGWIQIDVHRWCQEEDQ